MSVPVALLDRHEAGRTWPVLVWRAPPGWRAVSSALVGGGLGPCGWWVDATVDKEYFHPDPVAHARGIAAEVGLTGPGSVMLTAADVTRRTSADDGGVGATATVGLGLPVPAAVPEHVAAAEGATAPPGATATVGTINLLVVVPVPLSDAALVNAVVTATEAKTQALAEAGVPGTGTSSDAVCIACPGPPALPGGAAMSATASGPAAEAYGGPRSTWGARVARAVHAAVAAGTADWLAAHPPTPHGTGRPS